MGTENGVAVLVGLFQKITLAAGGFHDLCAAVCLPLEESRDLPRCGQYVRRGHGQLELQRVRIHEVDALGDVHIAVVGHRDRLTRGQEYLRQDAIVSTTSVSPSQCPIECPLKVGSGSAGCFRPSV